MSKCQELATANVFRPKNVLIFDSIVTDELGPYIAINGDFIQRPFSLANSLNRFSSVSRYTLGRFVLPKSRIQFHFYLGLPGFPFVVSSVVPLCVSSLKTVKLGEVGCFLQRHSQSASQRTSLNDLNRSLN